MDGRTKLTPQQERFCLKYHECGNASQAYRCAYPKSQKWTDNAVYCRASKVMGSAKVLQRVKELKAEAQRSSAITKEQVLAEFVKIGFSSIAYMHNTWIDRVEFETLTDDQKACIKSIQTKIDRRVAGDEVLNVEMVKIELYDKLSALNSINKMLGFDAPTKHEITAGIMDLSRLSDKELDAYYALIKKAKEQ